MTDVNPNFATNSIDVGRMLSAQEAQDFLASGRPVWYSASGVPFEATVLGPPQASAFVSDAPVMEDTFDAAGLSNDSAETSSDSADVSVTDEVESGSDVDSLESLANELESLADDLKADNESEAVDAFESAAGKLARAAEELRENPGDEDALEEFETAADELKEAAHGLEGEIDGDMYEQLTSAADGLERAADHMLGAEDGESSMASAMEEATGALEDLVNVMTDVMDSGDPLASLDQLTNELASVSNEFLDNVNAEASEKFDAATERLENAVDELRANPSDEDAIEEFETATDELKEATQGLEGEIDDGMYEKLVSAVDDLEKAGDRLMATDGDPGKMDGILADAVDSLRDIVDVAGEAVASVGGEDEGVTLADGIPDPLRDVAENDSVEDVTDAADSMHDEVDGAGDTVDVKPGTSEYQSLIDKAREQGSLNIIVRPDTEEGDLSPNDLTVEQQEERNAAATAAGDALIERLEEAGFSPLSEVQHHTGFFSVEVDADTLEQLTTFEGIEYIEENLVLTIDPVDPIEYPSSTESLRMIEFGRGGDGRVDNPYRELEGETNVLAQFVEINAGKLNSDFQDGTKNELLSHFDRLANAADSLLVNPGDQDAIDQFEDAAGLIRDQLPSVLLQEGVYETVAGDVSSASEALADAAIQLGADDPEDKADAVKAAIGSVKDLTDALQDHVLPPEDNNDLGRYMIS